MENNIAVIAGLNASGKTAILQEIANKEVRAGKLVVTNLPKIKPISKLSKARVDILKSEDVVEGLLYSSDLVVNECSISLVNNGIKYGEYFYKYLLLIVKEGDVLLLDEPELGLEALEKYAICDIIRLIAKTYDKVIIVTHDDAFYAVGGKNLFWCDDFELRSITEDEIYEYTG